MAWCLRGLVILCACGAVACGGHLVSSAAVASSSGPGGASGAAIPSGDWLTFGYDAQRDGVGPSDTGITAASVGQLSLRTVRIDGIADSSAVELSSVNVGGTAHEVIVVTTSYGKAIAIDPSSGAKLWEFVPRGVNSDPGNPQVTTSTPVIDPDASAVYSASPNGVVYKLSIASGREIWSRRVTLDPVHEKLASALTISGNYLVVATSGYDGDIPPYDGHVVTIDRSSGRIAHVWNTECSQRHRIIRAGSCPYTNTKGDNAIWGRGGAVIVPSSRDILVATGNGPFNGSINWGDSVLELSPDASHLLHNWTPTNQHSLDTSDTDVGSASPLLLPPTTALTWSSRAARTLSFTYSTSLRWTGRAVTPGRGSGVSLTRPRVPRAARF